MAKVIQFFICQLHLIKLEQNLNHPGVTGARETAYSCGWWDSRGSLGEVMSVRLFGVRPTQALEVRVGEVSPFY